tara:strand:- start:297 stop:602 length:306 start_codon:yes stop_codon:yes gene_type:complete
MQEFERFNIPSNLLQQLNEFSYGGFLLFSFDDKGSPRFYAQFDNELNMMALQKAAEYWIEGVHDINSSNIKHQLCSSDMPEDDDLEEGWHDLDDDDESFSS